MVQCIRISEVHSRGPSILIPHLSTMIRSSGFIPHARYTTIIILVINFGLFVATSVYGNSVGENRALIAFSAKFRLAIFTYHQWWRLVTAGFLHGGIAHIAMNSWVLFDLGAQVEEVYGTSRMIVFYF